MHTPHHTPLEGPGLQGGAHNKRHIDLERYNVRRWISLIGVDAKGTRGFVSLIPGPQGLQPNVRSMALGWKAAAHSCLALGDLKSVPCDGHGPWHMSYLRPLYCHDELQMHSTEE